MALLITSGHVSHICNNSCCYFNNFVYNFICIVVSCNIYTNNNTNRAALHGTTCVVNLVPVVLHVFITSCQPTLVGLNIYARSCLWQVTNVMCFTTLFLINPSLNITYYCHHTLTDIFRPPLLSLQNAGRHCTECRQTTLLSATCMFCPLNVSC